MEPTKPEIEFDHNSAEYAQNWLAIVNDLREKCPVAYTKAHGGYWVVTSYDDVAHIARHDDDFSSDHDPDGERRGFEGINIPPAPHRVLPIEMDPPEFMAYRRILNPFFSPPAVAELETRIVELTHQAIDTFIETGSANLIHDLGAVVPAIITMESMGLPTEVWEPVAKTMHMQIYLPLDSPRWSEMAEGWTFIEDLIFRTLRERRTDPRDDMISALVQAEVDGAPLSDQMVFNVAVMVLSGGVDTTTSLFGNAISFLDERHDLRSRLIADRSLLFSFGEEVLRYFTPTQALARTCTRDVEVGGQNLGDGDRVLISWAGANHDSDHFDHPETFVIDRFPNRHVSFGLGAHRCLGSTLARREFAIMLEGVLDRLPDYVIDRDRAERYPKIGAVNGWVEIPATFTPGSRR